MTHLVKVIKTGHNPLIPTIGQMGLDSSTQTSKPVTLASAANTAYPFVGTGFGYDA
jgi:hypothetical protein